LVETHSPIDAILAERGAKHVNVNLPRYFSEPATLDSEAKTFLARGMALAMEWAARGHVVPHVSQTIDSTVEAINAGLQSLKGGRGVLGKLAVIVDPGRGEVTTVGCRGRHLFPQLLFRPPNHLHQIMTRRAMDSVSRAERRAGPHGSGKARHRV
jgi:hypothetical protein